MWVRDGDGFYLVARNIGVASVRAEVDPTAARGLRLEGAPFRRVAPGQVQAFEFRHLAGEEILGLLRVRSDDGLREQWWERRSWRERALRLAGTVKVRAERWVVGSPAVLFPPEVRRQFVRIWNDSEVERTFQSETPADCKVTALGVPLGPNPLLLSPGGSLQLAMEPVGGRTEGPLTVWRAGPEAERLPIYRMRSSRPEKGCDLVVAIDFGTRNTGIRVRWRRTLVPAKPAGTVDAIGDRGQAARFPTQMVLHRSDRTFRWGSDAADYIAASRMTAEEVPVMNLKTYLREGDERYTQVRTEWTNAELVRRYFERIIHRLDEYLRTADPEHPVNRAHLDVRYVLCRPVLDANEGDVEGKRYEAALLSALGSCGIAERQVTFIHEPVAAAIGVARRRDELLALPDGTALAIVDSGGGTTDVALARVRLEAGRVSLDITGSYALHLAPDNPVMTALQYYGVRDRQVGGNVLDWALTHALMRNAAPLLEGEGGRPVPDSLWRPPADRNLAAAQMRDFVLICRQMKERFARASTQYLNRTPGQPREAGEVLPFPNRPDLQGIYLVHAHFDEHILAPTLRPVAEELVERINRHGGAGVRGQGSEARGQGSGARDQGAGVRSPELGGKASGAELQDREALGSSSPSTAGASDNSPSSAPAEAVNDGSNSSFIPHLSSFTTRPRSTEVRRVFYVGGTNIDPFVRQHFSRSFPLAPQENDPNSQSDARIAERLNAVVEGAVWYDEQLYAPSPVTLLLRIGTVEEVIIPEGAALVPVGVASPKFFTEIVDPGEELNAYLVAEGSDLPEPVIVCRSFYRNDTPVPQEATLRLTTSREKGQVAELQVGPDRRDQWRFALVEGED